MTSSIPLISKRCIPCEGGTAPMQKDQVSKYLGLLSTPWDTKDSRQLTKDFGFKNFKLALDFVIDVGSIAETENHHPDLYLHNWNKVRVDIQTHKIKGLTESDFILAAKIENLYSNLEDKYGK